MEQVFLYGTTIILGAFLFGLLFYSFYIVLTSKDENYEEQTGEDSTKLSDNIGSRKENIAIPNRVKMHHPTNQQPPKKTPPNKKGTRKAA